MNYKYKIKSNKVGCCPICDSDNLKYEKEFFNSDYLYFPYTCKDCGTRGREEYYLDFCKHTNICTKDNEYIDNSLEECECEY